MRPRRSSSPSSADSWDRRSPRHACTSRPWRVTASGRRPPSPTPLSGSVRRHVGRLRSRRGRRRAQRSGAGAVAPAGPRVAAGRGHPLDQRAGRRSARRSHPGCPEVGALWADPELDEVLDHEAVDRLPPAERQECRALRDAIDILIRRRSNDSIDLVAIGGSWEHVGGALQSPRRPAGWRGTSAVCPCPTLSSSGRISRRARTNIRPYRKEQS